MKKINDISSQALETSTKKLKRCDAKYFNLNNAVNQFKGYAEDLMGSDIFNKKVYNYDGSNISTIKSLILYFFNQQNSGLDLNKGIILYGKTGVGKSLIFDTFNNFLNAQDNGAGIPFFADGKKCRIRLFKIHAAVMTNDLMKHDFIKFDYCLQNKSIFIDEIGKETQNVMYFGNLINPIPNIIESRDLFPQLFYGTTNLNLSELQQTYGDRVFSRLNSMVNFIELSGNDRRN